MLAAGARGDSRDPAAVRGDNAAGVVPAGTGPVPGDSRNTAAAADPDKQRGIGAGGARYHIFQKLNVPRRVDDDVFALFGLEKAARRVDCNALRTLVLQGVE